jgi:hypothetical protein
VIDESGSLTADAEGVNAGYFRTPDRAGLVDGMMAGATSMFPNNGFMIRREAALEVGYSDDGRAGLAADFYFGFRLGRLGKPFYFVPEFTAMCRLTPGSLSRTGITDNAYRAVRTLLEELPPSLVSEEIQESVRRRIPIAITNAIELNDRKRALCWLFSRYYRSRLITLRGLKRLFLALLPFP